MKKIKNVRDRITDDETRNNYDKYHNYLSELALYEDYSKRHSSDKINIFRLSGLYKRYGIEVENKKDLEGRFEKFRSVIEKIKQKHPEVDLKNIRTQEGRNAVSDAIYEIQADETFKSADLESVAVIENFALYVAIQQVHENMKDRQSALEEYEISEEEFQRAEQSFKKYEKSGIMGIYDDMFKRNHKQMPNKIVHYAAGTLELRPSEARKSLSTMEILGKNNQNTFLEDKSYIVYDVSQMVIDNIMRDPKLTPEEKNRKICELEMLEYERVLKNVEEANQKQNTNRYKITREDEQIEVG